MAEIWIETKKDNHTVSENIFTREHVDRILGIGDQHFQDWDAAPELKQDWDALRPALVAAPARIATLEALIEELMNALYQSHAGIEDALCQHEMRMEPVLERAEKILQNSKE